MPIDSSTNLGKIKISNNAIAALTGTALAECYGVVGMTIQKVSDGINYLLKKENYAKGVIVKNTKKGIEIDLHVVLIEGIKISEVVSQIQQRVKYSLEKTLNIDVACVNVYVDGIKGL